MYIYIYIYIYITYMYIKKYHQNQALQFLIQVSVASLEWFTNIYFDYVKASSGGAKQMR